MQQAATNCNKLRYTATHRSRDMSLAATRCDTLQYTATHCSKLQQTALHCNTPRLGHGPRCDTLRHAATRYNTIHCITLQHTATNCNTPHSSRDMWISCIATRTKKNCVQLCRQQTKQAWERGSDVWISRNDTPFFLKIYFFHFFFKTGVGEGQGRVDLSQYSTCLKHSFFNFFLKTGVGEGQGRVDLSQ